jgi:hypothetical protein
MTWLMWASLAALIVGLAGAILIIGSVVYYIRAASGK